MRYSQARFLSLGPGLALVICAAPRPALAIGPSSKLHLAHLVLRGGSGPRAKGLAALGREIRRRTNISVARGGAAMTLSSSELSRRPLLITTSNGRLPGLSAADLVKLRRHLDRGGTWILDGPVGGSGATVFDASVASLARRLYPKHKLQDLPQTHTLWKSFYLLAPAYFRRHAVPLRAVVRDGRAVLIVVRGLSSAGAGAVFGRTREMLLRLTVNLAMYVLCVDYKSDQVHAPTILRRRQWRVR